MPWGRFWGGMTHIAIIGVFVLAWHASAIFEVRPYVSALYFACGVTFSVAIVWGWRYLPTVYAAAVLAYYTSFPDLSWTQTHWVGPLRQTVVYGLAGLSMRGLWRSDAFRLSLPVAVRFLMTALTASLLSASLAIHMPPFDDLPVGQTAETFFSFWGGDFAGVMVTVPIVLTLHRLLLRTGLRGWWTSNTAAVRQAWLKDLLTLSVLAQSVTCLAIALPHMLESTVRVDVLTLVPVLLAGLWRGALSGFLVAMQVSLLAVFVRPWLDIPAGLSIDLQLLIAMNAAVALLAGAAHDDKQHEWRRASYDGLTGLANYSYFMDLLERELVRTARSRTPLALLYLDLDGFKSVNDTHGHHAGDRLLTLSAKRLQACVRQSDIVARIGGDEFAILLVDTGAGVDAQRVAELIVDQIRQPFALDGHVVHVSASVGIAMAPADGHTPRAVMHAADQAMYRAKASGKNRFFMAGKPCSPQ